MSVLVSLGPHVPWGQHRGVQVVVAHPVVLHDNYWTVRLGNSPFFRTSLLFVLEGNITSSFKVAQQIQPWEMAQVESGQSLAFFVSPWRTSQGSQWTAFPNILKASIWARLSCMVCWSRLDLADLIWGLMGLKCLNLDRSSPYNVFSFRRLAQSYSHGSGERYPKKDRSEASWGLGWNCYNIIFAAFH